MADLVVGAWALLWWVVGTFVGGMIAATAVPVEGLSRTTGDIAQKVDEASRRIHEVPVVGDELSQPLGPIAESMRGLIGLANAQARSIHDTASLMAWVVFLVPTLTALLFYLPPRIRRGRETRLARQYIDNRSDLDLFALRAMAKAPMTKLAKISDDPVGAWRAGDLPTIRRLANLELRRVGIGVVEKVPVE